MKRCAIYGRYSSDLQSPTSITDQFRLCEAYAERHGWVVVARFQDAALSGFGVEHRPGYQDLIAAALGAPSSFDVILVEDLSRLTRDMGELLRLYHRLHLKGIELVGVSDGIATSQQGGKVTLAVRGLVNELYLDDLRSKTHRGLEGRVARGLSAGGRLFGYRSISVPGEQQAGKRSVAARFEIDEREAEIVRRIFRDYASGQSMKAIAHQLNVERLPFPAKDTKRGPARRGWAVSTIHTILRNEKYAGDWVWNKTRFLKDPDSGRRRPIPRPQTEWIRQERPKLRIVDEDLWHTVHTRLAEIRSQFGAGPGRPPRNGAKPVYSRHLLSGLLRCVCGARMSAQTAKRRRRGNVYAYGWYRCGFARDKGPTVCTHRTWYRQTRLEEALIAKYREAMTPAMVTTLVNLVNDELEKMTKQQDSRRDAVKTELLRLEREAGNLVRFLAAGGESMSVRDELNTIERSLQALRYELTQGDRVGVSRLRVDPEWVERRLARLDEVLRSGDVREATAEIRKHLDGELIVKPLPSSLGQRRAEITGRVRGDSLLDGQEAVRAVVGCGGPLRTVRKHHPSLSRPSSVVLKTPR
jgi:site-specific DNA recombinase